MLLNRQLKLEYWYDVDSGMEHPIYSLKNGKTIKVKRIVVVIVYGEYDEQFLRLRAEQITV